MTATATHDTKRGEDARARLMALSGNSRRMDQRGGALESPQRAASGDRGRDARAVGDLEYMLYQTLLGAWPLDGATTASLERIQAYALKAAREGKQETSWLNPHEAYEAGLQDIHRAHSRSLGFGANFSIRCETLARRIALLGALNSLSQLTLKATMPGVPDFYQGTEFWDLSLVDPDNRRPVDFAARADVLASVETPDWGSLVQNWPDGHLKLAWTRHLLKLRDRTRRCVYARRLSAAGGQRPASRPCHRLCAATWPRRRDRGRDEIARAVLARRPDLAARGRV